MLEAVNLDCMSATNGPLALEIVKQRAEICQTGAAQMFKLILLDYSLAEMDGPEIAREIRRLMNEKGIEQPYICCCSAYLEESFKTKAFEAGMNDYMDKPIVNERLQELLSRLGLL